MRGFFQENYDDVVIWLFGVSGIGTFHLVWSMVKKVHFVCLVGDEKLEWNVRNENDSKKCDQGGRGIMSHNGTRQIVKSLRLSVKNLGVFLSRAIAYMNAHERVYLKSGILFSRECIHKMWLHNKNVQRRS